MHEASVATSLIEIVAENAEKNNAKIVNKVFVKIGRLAAIEDDALTFAFDAIKEDFPIVSKAELVIENVPITGRCADCGKTDTYEEMFFSCSGCGSYSVELLTGEEFSITEIEVD
jgi:hydrogenase nickel incorporation protein HypA/HybF